MTTIFMGIIAVYIPCYMRKIPSTAKERRDYGFAMSTFGIVCQSGSSLIVSTISTGLSNSVSPSSAQDTGNLLTTIFGFLTMAAVVPSYFGLPKIPTRRRAGSFSELIFPLKGMMSRKNAVFLLLSYSVYTGVAVALYSNLFQIFATVLLPSPLHFSLYSLSSPIFSWSSYVVYFSTFLSGASSS